MTPKSYIDTAIIAMVFGLGTAKIAEDHFDGWATLGIWMVGMAIGLWLIVAYLLHQDAGDRHG